MKNLFNNIESLKKIEHEPVDAILCTKDSSYFKLNKSEWNILIEKLENPKDWSKKSKDDYLADVNSISEWNIGQLPLHK